MGGRDEFVERKARRLAWHGYATFALDMYGEGSCGKSAEENEALMMPFLKDRALLARRITAALTAVRARRRWMVGAWPRWGSALAACASWTWRAVGRTSAGS